MKSSPGRSGGASRSPSPADKESSAHQTGQESHAAESATGAHIVAAAKARLAALSQHLSVTKEEPTSSAAEPSAAAAKVKLAPKASAKFDTRQAALNKLAAKRRALAKSKAKTVVPPTTKLSTPTKGESALTAAATVTQSSSIQISLKSFNSKFTAAATSAMDKPTASIAPIMSLSSVSGSNRSTVTTVPSTGSVAAPQLSSPSLMEHKAEPVQPSPLMQAMQATLLGHASSIAAASQPLAASADISGKSSVISLVRLLLSLCRLSAVSAVGVASMTPQIQALIAQQAGGLVSGAIDATSQIFNLNQLMPANSTSFNLSAAAASQQHGVETDPSTSLLATLASSSAGSLLAPTTFNLPPPVGNMSMPPMNMPPPIINSGQMAADSSTALSAVSPLVPIPDMNR